MPTYVQTTNSINNTGTIQDGANVVKFRNIDSLSYVAIVRLALLGLLLPVQRVELLDESDGECAKGGLVGPISCPPRERLAFLGRLVENLQWRVGNVADEVGRHLKSAQNDFENAPPLP